MSAASLPKHLQKYIVDQGERPYTPVDQAVWRFALRQLRHFLSRHAHESYIKGLEETGIEIESIPKIEDISHKLSRFGWRALPVSGFIPPAAFMELQALNVLPIASDIRSLDHLLYTPAPDIIHEAAGHAPMLAHPEFAEYLTNYAQVAKKAIISAEDLAIYRAIRVLSDVKENPTSTTEDIRRAETELSHAVEASTHVSEATWLSRMNWWTAEYGLIGDLRSPRIFGAGLLSSVGEARWCLSDKVKKIPLTIDCINYSYDITEPQPQLFVTPDFATLGRVLQELAEKMAFRIGGISGVQRAIQAATINTLELNSGLQISGKCEEMILDEGNSIAYLRFSGPCQLSSHEKELPGHGTTTHSHGFGTPTGRLKQFADRCPSTLNSAEWATLGGKEGQRARFEFTSGVVVEGVFKSRSKHTDRTVLVSLSDAKAEYRGRVLFDPTWGDYDMAVGSEVVSVFGGPADRIRYGETEDFVASRVPVPAYSEAELRRHDLYGKVRSLRKERIKGRDLASRIGEIFAAIEPRSTRDWLLVMELYELALNRSEDEKLTLTLRSWLEEASGQYEIIKDGLELASMMD